MAKHERDALDNDIVKARDTFGESLTDIARAVGKSRSTVYSRLEKMKLLKPMVGGTVSGVEELPAQLPPKGVTARYILTSAQNNTKVHAAVWENLLALATHYNAELIVGTFSYNQNAFGQMSVKRGTAKHKDKLWYDEKLVPYIVDTRRELANGLVWCGEMNIMPTADDPLSGLDSYSGRRSAIFPHAKMSMKSVATMKHEGTKLNYTTGTVTLMNYIQKKAGLKGEHHHVYGAVLVEVDDNGNWWVRQLDADKQGRMQDLDVAVNKGRVTTGNRIEAVTWGDLHAADIDWDIAALSGKMLDTLKPKFQFIHDLLNGTSVNHHNKKNPHEGFRAHLRGFDSVEAELLRTLNVLWCYCRDSVKTVIVKSNHDVWLDRWLRENDYRTDPANAELFLAMQLDAYRAIRNNDKTFDCLKWAMLWMASKTKKYAKGIDKVIFLKDDESFKTCGNQIENGMHGHLGPNGSRGTPANLKSIGRRANTGHTHATGIYFGLYVAGTSSQLDCGYNVGPSSWTHSHVLTYPNGKRTIVTCYAGKWRA